MTSSSRCSSSSFHSSSRYSCSSLTSIQTGGSSTADPDFLPLLNRRSSSLFGGHDGDSESFLSLGGESKIFNSYQGEKRSHMEGYQGDWSHGDTNDILGQSSCTGPVLVDDRYFLSADVSRFEPHNIVVMAFNNSVVIHAEKVGTEGDATDRFTHKSLLPQDMDPLSLRGTLTPEGILLISVKSLAKSSTASICSNLLLTSEHLPSTT